MSGPSPCIVERRARRARCRKAREKERRQRARAAGRFDEPDRRITEVPGDRATAVRTPTPSAARVFRRLPPEQRRPRRPGRRRRPAGRVELLHGVSMSAWPIHSLSCRIDTRGLPMTCVRNVWRGSWKRRTRRPAWRRADLQRRNSGGVEARARDAREDQVVRGAGAEVRRGHVPHALPTRPSEGFENPFEGHGPAIRSNAATGRGAALCSTRRLRSFGVRRSCSPRVPDSVDRAPDNSIQRHPRAAC
jgi:hypothetical protein